MIFPKIVSTFFVRMDGLGSALFSRIYFSIATASYAQKNREISLAVEFLEVLAVCCEPVSRKSREKREINENNCRVRNSSGGDKIPKLCHHEIKIVDGKRSSNMGLIRRKSSLT